MLALFLLILASPQADVGSGFADAQALAASGRYEEAAVEYQRIAGARPGDARAWYALGRAWVGAAGQSYGQLMRTASPDSPYTAALIGDSLMRRLQYPRAIAVFRAAVAQEPALVPARIALAEMYGKLGRPEWAAKEQAAIAALDCAQHKLECDFRDGRLQALLAATAGDSSPAALYWHGQSATGLSAQAFAKLEQLPPSPELHRYHAGRYWESDRRLEVVSELREAVKLAPGDRDLREQLASALGAAGAYDEALRILLDLLRNAPDSPQLNGLTGSALLSLKRAEEAISYLKKCVAAAPGNLTAQASLGQAYMDTGEPKLALPYLEASASTDSDGSLHHLLAVAYRRTGQLKLSGEAMAKHQELAAKAAAPPPQLEIMPPQ